MLKVGQKVKYKSGYLIGRPHQDNNTLNEYTILSIQDSHAFIYTYPNAKGVLGNRSQDGKFTWEITEEEVEIIEVPKVILNLEYEEPLVDEMDENCTLDCRPGEHNCGK